MVSVGNYSDRAGDVLRIAAPGRQFRRNVQPGHPNPIIRHAVIDIESIRCTKIVTAIDASGKHHAVYSDRGVPARLRG